MEIKAFVRGFGSVIDLMPIKRPSKIRVFSISDEDAIKSDWKVVGNDIKKAINTEVEIINKEKVGHGSK